MSMLVIVDFVDFVGERGRDEGRIGWGKENGRDGRFDHEEDMWRTTYSRRAGV